MKRVQVEGGQGRWFDEDKATTFQVRGGRVLALTAGSLWMLRTDDSARATQITDSQADTLLHEAGFPGAEVMRTRIRGESAHSGPGRPATGERVEVRIPPDDLAVIDEIGPDRATAIRGAVSDRVNIRQADLDRWVDTRIAQSMPFGHLGVATELQIGRMLLALELARHEFTVAELCLVASVMNTDMVSTRLGAVIAFEVSDHMARAHTDPLFKAMGGYQAQWGIDEDQLLKKLEALGPAADLAMRIAIADFYSLKDADANDPDLWRGIGFTVTTNHDEDNDHD